MAPLPEVMFLLKVINASTSSWNAPIDPENAT